MGKCRISPRFGHYKKEVATYYIFQLCPLSLAATTSIFQPSWPTFFCRLLLLLLLRGGAAAHTTPPTEIAPGGRGHHRLPAAVQEEGRKKRRKMLAVVVVLYTNHTDCWVLLPNPPCPISFLMVMATVSWREGWAKRLDVVGPAVVSGLSPHKNKPA